MHPLGRCQEALSAVQSLSVLPLPHARVPRRRREYLLLGFMQRAGAVPQDTPQARVHLLSDGVGPRDDDGRTAHRGGDPW
jgi:hypothetical protein